MPANPAKAEAAKRRGSASTRPSRTRNRWLLAAAAVALLLVSSVVVTQRDGAAGGAAASAADVRITAAGGGGVGDQAPAFTTATTTGTTFALPAGKPAVVFFMAGWCVSCYPEAQALARIHDDMGEKVSILAVSPDPTDTLKAIERFAEQSGAGFGFAHDRTGALAQALGVRSLDTTVVVDAAGSVIFRDGVPTDEATLRAALAKAGAA